MKIRNLVAAIAAMLVTIATASVAFAQNTPTPATAPAATATATPAPLGCQAQYLAYRAAQTNAPACLESGQWDTLERLCRRGQLRIEAGYEQWVRNQPDDVDCGVMHMNVLMGYPRRPPVCETRWGATPVSRHGRVVDCTCANPSTIPVRVGRRFGCALAMGGAESIVANSIAPAAANDACAAGLTPEQCAELRNSARNVTAANASDFTRRLETLEGTAREHERRLNEQDARLRCVENGRPCPPTGPTSQNDQNAEDVRTLQPDLTPPADRRVSSISIGPADPPPAPPVTPVAVTSTTPPAPTRQHDYIVGAAGNMLGIAGGAQLHGLGSFLFETRHALSDSNNSFFIVDALAGVGGADRMGVELGGMLQVAFALQPVRWFSIGLGVAGTALGKPWGDSRFGGTNGYWAATFQLPLEFFVSDHAMLGMNLGAGVGQMTQIIDVRDANGMYHVDVSRRDSPTFAFNVGLAVGYRI